MLRQHEMSCFRWNQLPRWFAQTAATFAVLGAAHAGGAEFSRTETNPPAALTNVQHVLDLGPYRARQSHQPVRLRGTVLLPTRNPTSVLLHDGTACILVYGTNSPAELDFGKEIEVEGITESGLLAPIVVRAGLRVLGEAAHLPAPSRLPVARMMAGEGCWQYVRVEGIVRDMNRDRSNLALSLAAESRRFTVTIYGYSRFSLVGLPLDWLEARVVVDGVCWTDVNDRNQATSFHLVLAHTNQIQVLTPGNTNLFALPALPAAEAERLHQPSDARLKIVGTVVAQFPGDWLFLQTAFGPVEARLDPFISHGMPGTEVVEREPIPPLEAGDRIELIGAPAESPFAPLLLDANYRLTRHEAAPLPTPADIKTLLNGRYDAGLVRVTAQLLAHERRGTEAGFEESLVLQAAETVFEATWRTAGTNTLPALPLNARLRIDGICLVQPGPGNLRHTVQMLLRDSSDVRYLGQPPFWANWPLRRIVGLGVVLSVAASIWIYLLRRQVKQRTAALVAANEQLRENAARLHESEREVQRALEQERELSRLKSHFVSTVSHEFRTPLGVIMSSAENLRDYHERFTAEQRAEHLHDIVEATRTMSGLMEEVLLLGRVEAGKVTFRPEPLDLPALCERFVEEVRAATESRCPIQYAASPADRPARGDEGLLRHILVNLLSNAVKYSPPGSAVTFSIEPREAFAVFTVSDRGIGIPEDDIPHLFQPFHPGRNVGGTPGSGLGMVIVKRCVELHGGTMAFHSREGEGSTFIVRLPLFMKLG